MRRSLLGVALFCLGCSRPVPPLVSDAGTSADAAVVQLAADAALPALVKGYELYAWPDQGQLRFALVSWSKGEQSVDLLRAEGSDYRVGNWVSVRGRGLSGLRQALSRVPATASVILESVPALPPLSQAEQQAVLELLLLRSEGGEAGVRADDPARAAAALCTASGGLVDTSYCCTSSAAFPDTCSVGACGCAPERSRLTRYCVCPESTCFSPTQGCRRR
ncbi:MAG: hypothetical protein JWN48_2495 [Myxococcaceae bacterium]|nr:hypothetical protein [Myxococcaceae bacterium]